MGYFPFCIDIKNKKCVVVGGGTVALQKIEKLIMFEPKITVIAPEISDDILSIEGIRIIKRAFLDRDLDDVFFVITATNDGALNERIFRMCAEKSILVNTVDDKDKCSFIFPAIIKRENVTAAVSTDGKSPIYARYLRKQIEKLLDERTDKIIEILSSVRSAIESEISTEENRKLAFEKILAIALDDTDDVTDEKIEKIIGDLK